MWQIACVAPAVPQAGRRMEDFVSIATAVAGSASKRVSTLMRTGQGRVVGCAALLLLLLLLLLPLPLPSLVHSHPATAVLLVR